VYGYVYAYLCIDCGSQYQCFSVWTVSCIRICVRVHMYAYAYVCRYIYICAFFYSECCMHFGTGVFGTSAWADMYVTQVCFLHQRTHLRTHSLQVVYMCETPGGPKESRWTKSLHTYVRICVQSVHVYVYTRRRDEILVYYVTAFFLNIFFLSKRNSKRCKSKTPIISNLKYKIWAHRPSIKGWWWGLLLLLYIVV